MGEFIAVGPPLIMSARHNRLYKIRLLSFSSNRDARG
jgi:hypothetical protein